MAATFAMLTKSRESAICGKTRWSTAKPKRFLDSATVQLCPHQWWNNSVHGKILKTTLKIFRPHTKTQNVCLDKIANCSQKTSSNFTKLLPHQVKTCINWFQWLFGLFRVFLGQSSWWQFGFRCPIFPGLLVLVSSVGFRSNPLDFGDFGGFR